MRMSNKNIKISQARAKRSTQERRIKWHQIMDKKYAGNPASRKQCACTISMY